MGGKTVRKLGKSGSPKVAAKLGKLEGLFKFYKLFPSQIFI